MKHIIEVLENRVKESSTLIALSYKDNQKWHYYRWQDVLRITKLVGAGLLSLDIEPKDSIGIISTTRVKWMLSDIGCMMARAISIPIYPNLSEEETSYIINHSECKLLIIEDMLQLQSWKKIKDKCPSVKHIIVMRPDESELPENCYTWNQLLQRGSMYQTENSNWYQTNFQAIETTDVFTIPYTSGTTGKPKGVVLSYKQILSEMKDVFALMPVDERDTSLCFLPQSHIMGRLETFGSIYAGYKVAFAESIELFKKNMEEVKPTFIIAVPRVFEKIHTAIQLKLSQSAAASKPIKSILNVGKSIINTVENKNPIPLKFSISNLALKYLLGGKIKAGFGGRLRFAFSGGAPLSKEIAEFFFAVGIPVYEGYGLTETTASVCFNSPLKYKLGTVGPAIGDVEIKIAEEDGEILVKSDKVMVEYYKNPEETNKVFVDGYFRTGDIGEIDSEGFVKITDRKKDLIKTAGGKYVVPQKLLNRLKLNPLISQALIIGDQRRYVIALITLDKDSAISFAMENSIEFKDYQDLLENKKMIRAIKDIVAEANSTLASFESIKKFKILPEDFTVEGGELTPSMKIKRRVIEEKYSSEIEMLYGN